MITTCIIQSRNGLIFYAKFKKRKSKFFNIILFIIQKKYKKIYQHNLKCQSKVHWISLKNY